MPRPGVRLAGPKVAELRARAERLDLDWKQRRAHQPSHRAFYTGHGLKMACPQSDGAIGRKQRREERQADDVVDMEMAEKDIEQLAGSFEHKRIPERTDAGAGVEDQNLIAAANLHARGVATVACGAGSRARDAAANAPEADGHLGSSRLGAVIIRHEGR